jgi:hypothetical protein
MIGRKSAVGLSLLCALAFCAFAASSAQAVKGTTVFGCQKVESGAQFSDAHCDTAKEGGAGFKHKEITPGTLTEVESNNEKTKNATTEHTTAVLEGEAFGIKTKIECTKSSTTGSLTNNAGPPMNASGTATVKYTECKEVLQKCKVAEPIEVKEAKAKTLVIKEAAPEEMGVEFQPKEAGKPFVVVTFSECANFLVNGKHEITGSAIGTPGGTANGKGATLVFTKAMTEKTLKFAGNPAPFESSETVKMKGSTEAVTLTTTAT